jgi:hypothetical protein
MKCADLIEGFAMKDLKRLNIAELQDRKMDLDKWIDDLAIELAEINKELVGRFRTFRDLCFTPVESLKPTQPARRGLPKPRDL